MLIAGNSVRNGWKEWVAGMLPLTHVINTAVILAIVLIFEVKTRHLQSDITLKLYSLPIN